MTAPTFRLGLYLDNAVRHVRVGNGRRDGTRIELIGSASELHGPAGVCSCCPRRDGKSEALASVNAAASDDDRARIDAAILAVASRGGVFSANDVRPLLADAHGPLIGARFNALARAGRIRRVGYEPSTKGNTHGHEVKTWEAAA